MRHKTGQAFYSQNFLRDPELVTRLIRNSSIGKNDTVVEIGSGKGIITSGLLVFAAKVIATEKDHKLFLYLKDKFSGIDNLNLVYGDFLKLRLPTYTYKVFANIPFIISADIVRRLTENQNFSEGYLIVQKEFAQKLMGKPYDKRNQMASVLLKPWFEIKVVYDFDSADFIPSPNVDVVMIKIKRRSLPLVPWSRLRIYRDYILYSYNRQKISKFDFEYILNQFNGFIQSSTFNQRILQAKKATKILSNQQKLKKIHRTRKDRNWKKYKYR